MIVIGLYLCESFNCANVSFAVAIIGRYCGFEKWRNQVRNVIKWRFKDRTWAFSVLIELSEIRFNDESIDEFFVAPFAGLFFTIRLKPAAWKQIKISQI